MNVSIILCCFFLLCIYHFLYLSLSLYLCLSLSLSVFFSLSFYLYLCLFHFIILSVKCLFLPLRSLYMYFSLSLSLCLFVSPSPSLSVLFQSYNSPIATHPHVYPSSPPIRHFFPLLAALLAKCQLLSHPQQTAGLVRSPLRFCHARRSPAQVVFPRARRGARD